MCLDIDPSSVIHEHLVKKITYLIYYGDTQLSNNLTMLPSFHISLGEPPQTKENLEEFKYYDEKTLWQQPEIANALKTDELNKTSADNHVFIVLGTSVVEVGRDHDYDWAIAEPSSLRSIIQLAGRIQRHRQAPPSDANLVVLNQNIRALKGEKVAYCKPGFETRELPLNSKDLNELLTTELDNISAIPRIVEPKAIKADDFKKSAKNRI